MKTDETNVLNDSELQEATGGASIASVQLPRVSNALKAFELVAKQLKLSSRLFDRLRFDRAGIGSGPSL